MLTIYWSFKLYMYKHNYSLTSASGNNLCRVLKVFCTGKHCSCSLWGECLWEAFGSSYTDNECLLPLNIVCTIQYNNHDTLLLVNISLYFTLQQELKLVTFNNTCQLPFFFPSSYALFCTFISKCHCTPQQYFYKGCI